MDFNFHRAPPWTEPTKKPKSALAEAPTLSPSEDIHHTDAYALGIIFLELLQEFSTGRTLPLTLINLA